MPTGTSYLPVKDDDFNHWLENFTGIANLNHVALALTSADLQDINNASENFSDGLSTAAAAKAAAKTATLNKDTARKTAEVVVRAIVKRIQAMPSVPPSLKLQLGITVSSGTHKPLPVYAPDKAVAKIEAGGIISVVWDVNGNAPGAIYTIEASNNMTTGWTIVNAQTASRFFTLLPGTNAPTYYRIKAQRGDRVSDYSNTAVVNGG